MIAVRLQERLDELNKGAKESEQKSFSWLARTARVSHQTLWRMKYNLSRSIDKENNLSRSIDKEILRTDL